MQIVEFVNRLAQDSRGKHRVGPPLEEAELQIWCETWPRQYLPEDFVSLLKHVNGIDFWVDEGSPLRDIYVYYH